MGMLQGFSQNKSKEQAEIDVVVVAIIKLVILKNNQPSHNPSWDKIKVRN